MITEAVSHSSPSSRSKSSESFIDGTARRLRRFVKFARRAALNAVGQRQDTRILFIMGAQRSGTRIPLLALESAPDIVTYREGAAPYFNDVLLRPDGELRELVKQCLFPTIVLKPLCESHRVHQLLDRFPGSKVLWIYRSYQDTVNSASVKWTSGASAVEQLVTGRLSPVDWRWGGLTPEAIDVARRLYTPGLSVHHGNAIMWYLRNRLMLDLAVFDSPRVQVIKYEDLATAPAQHFPRVFDFIGEPLGPGYLKAIHAGSVRRSPFPQIPGPVAEACESLYREIDRRYALDVGRHARRTS